MESENVIRLPSARASQERGHGAPNSAPATAVVTPFGPIRAPVGVRLAPRIRPMQPTTYERRLVELERIARLRHRVGIACVVLSHLSTLYFIAQLARAVLS